MDLCLRGRVLFETVGSRELQQNLLKEKKILLIEAELVNQIANNICSLVQVEGT